METVQDLAAITVAVAAMTGLLMVWNQLMMVVIV